MKRSLLVFLLAAAGWSCSSGGELPLSRKTDGRFLLKAPRLADALSSRGLFKPFWPPDASPLKENVDYTDEAFFGGIERLEAVPGRQPRRFEISTNSRGFRTDPFEWKKPEGTFRVAAFGDSTVFGLPVPLKDSFMETAERELASRYPGLRFEFIGLGVPGFTLERIRNLYRGLDRLEADVILFGSAFNDYGVEPHPDRIPLDDPLPVPSHRWAILPESQETVPQPPAEDIERTWRVFGPWKWTPQKTRQEFADELEGLTRDIRERHQTPLFMHLEQARRYYAPVIARLQTDLGLGILDTRAVLLDGGLEKSLERDPAAASCPFEARAPEGKSVLWHVRMISPPGFDPADGYSVMIHRLGSDQLKPGLSAPWPLPPVPLNDSGRDGDEKAGDGILSASFRIPVGETLQFYFVPGRNAPLTPERRLGHDTWAARFLHTWPEDLARYHRACDPVGTYTSPVYEYGKWDLMEEPVHPDTEGHRAIGRALADLIETLPAFRAFAAGPR